MSAYQSAVPVLQVANVEASVRWYIDVLGFVPQTFPQNPPFSFAMLRRDGAEIMLQCGERGKDGGPDPEFLWSVYLRIGDAAVLEVAAAAGTKTQLLRGPERMFYGLVEFEICDPDGYRICVGGEAPPGANVKMHQE
ncbi:MAG TPA: VOC family protein [Candidatus Polarisedimenticolia bacterium]|nr:VOC family protein [Candidatus Polarisedimenticolia bacterium]